MRTAYLFVLLLLILGVSACVFGQGTVVVNDPTVDAAESKLSAAEEAIFNKQALPSVRKQVTSDICTESVEVAGVIHGSFTKAGSHQSVIFYQFCQTGNGLGHVGLVLIDGGKVIANYISDSGWSQNIGLVKDIDRNGLDEFTLAYGGGMHQGQGGIGVDLMQFVGTKPVGIGWYQAEKFDESDTVTVWKLTAKPGKPPVFYRQKYLSAGEKKWRRSGAATIYKLGKAYAGFTAVK